MLLALFQGMTGTTLELFSFVHYFNSLLFTGMSFGEFSMPSGITRVILSGLVISALCGDENTALQVAIAAFYPVLVLSGKWYC